MIPLTPEEQEWAEAGLPEADRIARERQAW
jgi:hypothetical protein